ncbi:hypothetical protein ACYF6T_12405 [Streptomyces sp. 7R007]
MSIVVRLSADGGDLVVRLPWRWVPAARCREVRMPLACVDEVRVEPHWWRALRPRPGRRYRFRPGRWCVGELEGGRSRDFVAVRAQGPVLVVSAFGPDAPYGRLAVSTDEPERTAAWLRQLTAKTAEKS